jgi:hypothetical protein
VRVAAGLVVQVTPGEYWRRSLPSAGLVEGLWRRRSDLATGEYACYHTAVLEFFRRPGLYGKFHPLLLGNTRQLGLRGTLWPAPRRTSKRPFQPALTTFPRMIFLRAAQREFTQNAVAVFVALFAILISTVLIRLLGQAAGGRVPADAVLALIGFGAIAQMPVVLSLTVFIAILMSLSRCYRDSEMVVWFSSGVPLTAWMRPVLRFAVPVVDRDCGHVALCGALGAEEERRVQGAVEQPGRCFPGGTGHVQGVFRGRAGVLRRGAVG